eukprot:m.10360 g.10360  ORF g.10360 m.10360 type:complete len:716 (-) comp8263_c0_seq1:29-2176(-)
MVNPLPTNGAATHPKQPALLHVNPNVLEAVGARKFNGTNRKCWNKTGIQIIAACTLMLVVLVTLQTHKHVEPQPTELPQEPTAPLRVLITGVAGFIGFSLASRLLESDIRVTGIDNFNDYYDVELKADRAYRLQQLGATVLYGNVCDSSQLTKLFQKNNFTHVFHMAAQAGVRFSLVEPQLYVHNNVECFAVLLNVLAKYKHVKFLFASSSSVLGSAAAAPLNKIKTNTKPASVYAATKRSNEILARLFHEKYGIRMVGLRFFTVYGPWGRPDMSVVNFATQILKHEQVLLYDHPELARDFTYIDDIVDGIVSVMNKQFSFGLYNLGRGSPDKVTTLISLLEKELHQRANTKTVPIPRSEVIVTWADISTSRRHFGFNPKVSLKVGLARVVTWLDAYNKERKTEESRVNHLKSLAQENSYEELLSPSMQHLIDLRRTYDGTSKSDGWERMVLDWSSEVLKKRKQLEQKWDFSDPGSSSSHHRGSLIGRVQTTSNFKFVQGFDFEGFNVEQHTVDVSQSALEAKCAADVKCVGFSTHRGELKKRIPPFFMWSKCNKDHASCGVHLRSNVNICHSRLHLCGQHAVCTRLQQHGDSGVNNDSAAMVLSKIPPNTSSFFYSCDCERGFKPYHDQPDTNQFENSENGRKRSAHDHSSSSETSRNSDGNLKVAKFIDRFQGESSRNDYLYSSKLECVDQQENDDSRKLQELFDTHDKRQHV